MGSSRLPGKVLKNLEGKPVIEWVVNAAQAIPHIDHVIIATSTETQDDAIESWCKDNGIDIFRGSEQNVLERYYKAATQLDLKPNDLVMRLTADCPLLDPELCGETLSLAARTGKDYVNNIGNPRSWPDGLDCEVFKFQALEQSYNESDDDLHKEHVTLYIRRNPDKFECLSLSCPLSGIGDYRWTLDTKDDYTHIQNLIKALKIKNGEEKFIYAYTDILAIEEENRETKLGNANGLEKSQEHLKRALKTIPSASQTYSKSYIQHIEGISPFFIERGKDAYVWDIDGNQYIDYLAGLLPVLLGYSDPDVDEAIKAQLAKGISFSLSAEIEAELAEMLVDMIPCAEMVRFAKNGSDVTAGAIRLARAYTGRTQVATCGYHGWHDWYIGTTAKDLGVPEETKNLADIFTFNDIESLKSLLAQKQYAAIILEAEGAEKSENNFLEEVRKEATKHGAILVYDEIVSGFRSSLGGIQERRGVVPDLACFGKAMGNGMPISALAGKKEIMHKMDDIFFSGTFGGEALSIAAAIACLQKYKRINGVKQINDYGHKLQNALNGLLKEHGIQDILSIKGESWWPVITVNHDNPAPIKMLIRQELARNGIIQGNSFNITTSHCNDVIWNQTLEAWQNIVKAMAGYLENSNPEKFLINTQTQSAFQVRL